MEQMEILLIWEVVAERLGHMLRRQVSMAEVHTTLRLAVEAVVAYLSQPPELHTQVV